MFWEPSMLGAGVVGLKVVKASGIRAGVEGGCVGVVGIEG
jgi:hypothetical protein